MTGLLGSLLMSILNAVVYLLLLRFMLQFLHADFYNPISANIIRFSDYIVGPVRKILPPKGRYDLASLVLAAIIVLIEYLLAGVPISVGILLAIAPNLLAAVSVIMMAALILLVILSWTQLFQTPAYRIASQLVEPILSPISRVLPNLAGIDFSPLVAILLLQFAMRFFEGLQIWLITSFL